MVNAGSIEDGQPAPLHISGTESAAIVRTTHLREVTVALTRRAVTGGAVIVEGAPGLGKTFATHLVTDGLGMPCHWVAMPDRPKGKEMIARINQVITGRMPAKNRTEFDLLEETVRLLAGPPVVLVIDEAQHLQTGPLRQLRYLYDRPETTLLLVLVGADAGRSVSFRCPELESRIEAVIHFKPFSGSEMRAVLESYHPMFAKTGPEVMAYMWSALGGNFREWAKVLKAALSLGIAPDEGLSLRNARATLRAVGRPRQGRRGPRELPGGEVGFDARPAA